MAAASTLLITFIWLSIYVGMRMLYKAGLVISKRYKIFLFTSGMIFTIATIYSTIYLYTK